MTVKELQEMLNKYPDDYKITLGYKIGDFCITCGHDEEKETEGIKLIDFGTRLCISSQ